MNYVGRCSDTKLALNKNSSHEVVILLIACWIILTDSFSSFAFQFN